MDALIQKYSYLVNQHINKWTVIRIIHNQDKHIMEAKCQCDCGNEIIVPSQSLKTLHTTSCGCANFYYNGYIDRFLTSLEIKHQREYPVKINNRCYKFDFYLPEYKLFIEYDGEQHYHPIGFGEKDEIKVQENFEKTKINDNIKNEYCKQSEFYLLRISYLEKENVEKIISNYLQRLSEKGSFIKE